MKTLTTEQVKAKRDKTEDFALINVLDTDKFREAHIPDSQNVPVLDENFEAKVEELVGSKEKEVVVYCASQSCDASPAAAKKLEAAGFTQVYDYEGGTKAWKEAGLPLETG